MINIHIKKYSATFIFDRGYDDQKLINKMIEFAQYFIIRMAKNRVIYIKIRKATFFMKQKKKRENNYPS